jgi:hypothetical protein
LIVFLSHLEKKGMESASSRAISERGTYFSKCPQQCSIIQEANSTMLPMI